MSARRSPSPAYSSSSLSSAPSSPEPPYADYGFSSEHGPEPQPAAGNSQSTPGTSSANDKIPSERRRFLRRIVARVKSQGRGMPGTGSIVVETPSAGLRRKRNQEQAELEAENADESDQPARRENPALGRRRRVRFQSPSPCPVPAAAVPAPASSQWPPPPSQGAKEFMEFMN